MLGAIDLTPFTEIVTDVTTSVGTVGVATVGVFTATLAFPFVMRWGKKVFNAGTGRTG